MRCPRCEGSLSTFSIEAAGESAVVCESCGFSGIPASHRTEAIEVESWDQVVDRFDETVLPPARTSRARAVSTPRDDSGPSIDPARLEESVSVGTSLRSDRPDETTESDADEQATLELEAYELGSREDDEARSDSGAEDGNGDRDAPVEVTNDRVDGETDDGDVSGGENGRSGVSGENGASDDGET